MLFKNAQVFTDRRGFVPGGFTVENGRFETVFTGGTGADGVDLQEAWVIPGLVDMHIHGAAGADLEDGDADGLVRMGRYLARRGVTSFVPTAVAMSRERLAAAVDAAVAAADRVEPGCARIAGVRLEGPYLSSSKKGAQNEQYLRRPDLNEVNDLFERSGGRLLAVDVSPEIPGAAEFAREVSGRCLVSAAHTGADYETAGAFFEAGGRHLTHLFNAMGSIHHRRPGVIGAASERENVTAELICDGVHVHPSAVRMAYRLFSGRICLVSDALRCCGMPDGEYELGGQPVYLSRGEARLSDGTIAGSAADLFTCMRRAMAFGIPAGEAVRSAACRPAEALGLERRLGDIAPGLAADFVVCGREWQPLAVYMDGRLVT